MKLATNMQVSVDGVMQAKVEGTRITEGDEDHEIAQTLAATVPNAELFVYPGEAHYLAEHDRRATPPTRPRLPPGGRRR